MGHVGHKIAAHGFQTLEFRDVVEHENDFLHAFQVAEGFEHHLDDAVVRRVDGRAYALGAHRAGDEGVHGLLQFGLHGRFQRLFAVVAVDIHDDGLEGLVP